MQPRKSDAIQEDDNKTIASQSPSGVMNQASGILHENNMSMESGRQQSNLVGRTYSKGGASGLMQSFRESKNAYIEKKKYGGVGHDDSDDSDDPDLANKTPQTKRRIKDENAQKKVKKLSACATYMTLMKGFVCSACLYLPRSFVKGGYGFTNIAILLSGFVTIYCAMLLIQIRTKVGASSYTAIGEKLFGKTGKIMVNIALCLSQIGFVCAYLYFIMVNFSDILYHAFGKDVSRFYIAIAQFVVFTLLCFVRKIEIFASTHVFADLMIVVALVTIVAYGTKKMVDEGTTQIDTIPFVNTKTYSDAIGFSVYAFEGIGIILPVQDITANPDGYYKIVIAVITTVALIYVMFGQFCVFAWGAEMTTPLITDELPNSAITYIVKFLFSINLLFSYPLVLYPANIIVENILYDNMEKTRRRQMLKNITRTLMVFATVTITILLGDKLDKFLSILGALTCTPIAFTFPALFHFRACAESKSQKFIDGGLVFISLIIMVYCTSLGVKNWADTDEPVKINFDAIVNKLNPQE